MNANPTQGQLLHREYLKKKEELKDTTKVSILATYGGEEYLEKAPKELLQGQTEEYVEFSRTGQVIKGKERAKARSKYSEDGNYSYLIVRSPFHSYHLTSQYTSTITLRYGVHGTTLHRGSGVMLVVTRPRIYRTVQEKLVSKLQQRPARRTSLHLQVHLRLYPLPNQNRQR